MLGFGTFFFGAKYRHDTGGPQFRWPWMSRVSEISGAAALVEYVLVRYLEYVSVIPLQLRCLEAGYDASSLISWESKVPPQSYPPNK